MSFAKTRGRHCTWNLRVACGVAAKACADAAALRAKRPAADDGERERRRQMRGTAEEAAAAAVIAPPSSETSTSRKKRALIVRGASHDAVLARIDASRRAQVGSQIWVGYIRRQAGAGVGGKRAAEGRADDDDARVRARQRVSGG